MNSYFFLPLIAVAMVVAVLLAPVKSGQNPKVDNPPTGKEIGDFAEKLPVKVTPDGLGYRVFTVEGARFGILKGVNGHLFTFGPLPPEKIEN